MTRRSEVIKRPAVLTRRRGRWSPPIRPVSPITETWYGLAAMRRCRPTEFVRSGAAEAVCRRCGRTVGGIAEARVYQGARDTGADVQRGAGVAGREGVGGAGGAAVAGGQPGAANCSRGTAGCCRLRNRVGGSRFTRSGGGWPIRSRLAGLEADIAAGRVRLCFGSKRLWRNSHLEHGMATPVMRNGSGTGVIPRSLARQHRRPHRRESRAGGESDCF